MESVEYYAKQRTKRERENRLLPNEIRLWGQRHFVHVIYFISNKVYYINISVIVISPLLRVHHIRHLRFYYMTIPHNIKYDCVLSCGNMHIVWQIGRTSFVRVIDLYQYDINRTTLPCTGTSYILNQCFIVSL